MITKTLLRRLEWLEEQMSPNAEPIIIDVVFVNAAKERKGGFQVKIPMNRHGRHSQRSSAAFRCGRS